MDEESLNYKKKPIDLGKSIKIEFPFSSLFLKTVLAQNESPLGEKRLLFSDSSQNFVRQYDTHLFFWISYRPLKVVSKLIVDDLADFTKTNLETLLLRIIHR